MFATLLFAGSGERSNLILLTCAAIELSPWRLTSLNAKPRSLPQASSIRSARTPSSRPGQTCAIF